MTHKVFRWTKLIVICAVALLIFSFALRQVNRQTEELQAQEDTLLSQLTSLQQKQETLSNEIAQVGTDSYIEERARRDYQFVSPGEMRFVITNPEALYDQPDTSLTQSVQVLETTTP